MALAKRTRGGMSGWVAAALLALAIYAAQTEEAPEAGPDITVDAEAAEAGGN